MTSPIGHHWWNVCSRCTCTIPCNMCRGQIGPILEIHDQICPFTFWLTWLYDQHKTSYLPKLALHPVLQGEAHIHQVTWLVSMGSNLHIYNLWPYFAFSPYKFYKAAITIMGSLQIGLLGLACKWLLTPQKGFCGGFYLLNREQYLQDLKRHTLAWVRIIWAIKQDNLWTCLTCRWVTKKGV